MKILFYDCFSGISGDMNLGAMLDLGVDGNYLTSELNKLGVQGWKLEIVKDQRHGIKGTKATVRQTRHEHAHRHLSDIEKIINDSNLQQADKILSLKIFLKVAEAEAKVHGIPIGNVHFHEVGAIDSIIDIVGAAICFNALKVDEVHVSVVELGGGMVKCDHGKLPVPAPATAEIIQGVPTSRGAVDFEATTPTGAAIVKTLGTVFNSRQPISILRTGYGIGQKEHPDVPNLLRVYLAETESKAESGHEALHIECNIDDMNPEFFDYVSDKLFASGASDVFLTNNIMKKGRPGIVLNVILEKENAESVKNILFTETTTLGVRTTIFSKDTLVRKFESINTSFGTITVKRSFYHGSEVSCKPEYEECRKIALEQDRPLKEIYNTIISEITQKGKK
jgi:pyridinium-3,5-bisthiocarboxylic acid mononucleotide nickel chelatase